jgi:hypothetical protein
VHRDSQVVQPPPSVPRSIITPLMAKKRRLCMDNDSDDGIESIASPFFTKPSTGLQATPAKKSKHIEIFCDTPDAPGSDAERSAANACLDSAAVEINSIIRQTNAESVSAAPAVALDEVLHDDQVLQKETGAAYKNPGFVSKIPVPVLRTGITQSFSAMSKPSVLESKFGFRRISTSSRSTESVTKVNQPPMSSTAPLRPASLRRPTDRLAFSRLSEGSIRKNGPTLSSTQKRSLGTSVPPPVLSRRHSDMLGSGTVITNLRKTYSDSKALKLNSKDQENDTEKTASLEFDRFLFQK